tara:strand:+ start:158576 stop:159607 length:1032 start_codon:yes stop_codon:yes gene_type:complete
MRFLHTADIHFGASLWLPDSLERHEEMFDNIFDIAYEENVEVVVIAGDLFDTSDPPREVRELVQRKVLQYDEAGFHVLVIPGNHDLVTKGGETALAQLAELYQFGRLRNSVITEKTMFHQIGDTLFCLLSHGRDSFKDACRKAVESVSESSLSLPHRHFVVVCHETIRGSLSDVKLPDGSYYKLKDGEEAPDGALPVTYWALGDIHMHQKVGRNAFYSGAPLQLKFGDAWPKGVLIVDTDHPTEPKFVPVSSVQLAKVRPNETAPPNSHVKLVAKSKEDLGDVKANVVKIQVDTTAADLTLNMDDDLQSLIVEGVQQQGADPVDVALAEKEVESLLRSVDLDA